MDRSIAELRGGMRAGLVAAALLAAFLLPARGRAQDIPVPTAAEPTSVWLYSLYKTVTYETATNLADVPLYSLVLGAAPAASGLFNAVNVVSAGATYYAYEVAWHHFGPPLGDTPAEAVRTEIAKTLLYRVVSSARNMALGYAFAGSPAAALGFMVWGNVVDTAIYAANEYAWYRWGPPVATVWGGEPAPAAR